MERSKINLIINSLFDYFPLVRNDFSILYKKETQNNCEITAEL